MKDLEIRQLRKLVRALSAENRKLRKEYKNLEEHYYRKCDEVNDLKDSIFYMED